VGEERGGHVKRHERFQKGKRKIRGVNKMSRNLRRIKRNVRRRPRKWNKSALASTTCLGEMRKKELEENAFQRIPKVRGEKKNTCGRLGKESGEV